MISIRTAKAVSATAMISRPDPRLEHGGDLTTARQLFPEAPQPFIDLKGCGASGNRCRAVGRDRKSTRLNSSHGNISYAVFRFKKKKIHHEIQIQENKTQ